MQGTDQDSSGQSASLGTSLAGKKKRKKREGKSPHPGVYILEPSGLNVSYRIRYTDPETGKVKVKNLPPDLAKSELAQTAYAVKLYKQLRRRKEDIQAGDAPHREADQTLAAAIDHYFKKGHGSTLGESTQLDYLRSAEVFLRWASDAGVTTVRELTKGKLATYPTYVQKVPKRIRKVGGRRGEMADGGKLSAHSVNKMLRNAVIILNELRRTDVIKLSSDDLSDSLRRIKAPMELKPFLRPADIRQLLDACRRHDEVRFVITRDRREDANRFPPIQEYVEFLLLTGVRLDESLKVTGSMVHPETQEILLPAEICKWELARSLDLTVSVTLSGRAAEMQKRGTLFGHLTEGKINAALRRLHKSYGAPKCNVHKLRRTCGTYMACTALIGPWRATKQLGHRSMDTAEKHYLGNIRIDPDVRTLEAAMGLRTSLG